VSAHAFGEGAIARCHACKAVRSRRGRGYIYAPPEGSPWADSPSPCPGAPEAPEGLEGEAEGGSDGGGEGGWRSQEIVFFDLETTGLDPRIHVPTEVGLVRGRVRSDGSVAVSERYVSLCYVPPAMEAHARETSAITGIAYEDLLRAPSFGYVAAQVSAFLSRAEPGAVMASYNSAFDVPFFGYAHVRAGCDLHALLLQPAVLDPMLWSRRIDRYVTGGHKLTTVASRKGLLAPEEMASAHRADFDAELGLRVLAHFARDKRVPAALDELHLWQRVARAEWEAHYFGYRLRQMKAERAEG